MIRRRPLRLQTRGMKGWTATLLLVSGFGSILAAAERWLPACGPGRLSSVACTRVESHLYDFTVPSAPWRPLGHAAALQGFALLLLALAAVTLTPLLLGVRRPLTAWLTGGAFGAAFALVGAQTLLSGRAGSVVTVPGTGTAAVATTLVWPLALIAVLLSLPVTGQPSIGWRAAAAVSLLAASPVGASLVAAATVPVAAYDTVPWTEAVGGLATILAGLALLPIRPPRWRPALPLPALTVPRAVASSQQPVA